MRWEDHKGLRLAKPISRCLQKITPRSLWYKIMDVPVKFSLGVSDFLQSPSAVILEPPKIKSATVSPSICHEVMGLDAMSELLELVMDRAAKSLQSCPTLCDPIDGSPPGSSVHGIFQARVLEWGAIAFSVPYTSLWYFVRFLM